MPSGMWSYKHGHDGVEAEDRFYFGCKNYGIARFYYREELENNGNIRKCLKKFTWSCEILHQILHIFKNTTLIFFQTTLRDDIPDQRKINTCCDKIKLTNEIICEFRAMASSVQLSPGKSRIPNSYDFPFYECNQPNLYIFHVDYSGLGIWIISGRFQFLGPLLVQFERIHQCRWQIRIFLTLTSPFF